MGKQTTSGCLKITKMDSNNSKYVLKKKTSYIILFLTILYMFVLIYMIFVIAIDNNIADILFLILFMILFLFFFIDNLCWQLNGKEIVSFEKNGISIKKKGRLLNSRKFIFYEDIDNVFYEKMKYSAWRSWGVFWGWRGGCIKIEYRGSSYYYVGQSLSYDEAKFVIPDIKNTIDSFSQEIMIKNRAEQDYYEKLYENWLRDEESLGDRI